MRESISVALHVLQNRKFSNFFGIKKIGSPKIAGTRLIFQRKVI